MKQKIKLILLTILLGVLGHILICSSERECLKLLVTNTNVVQLKIAENQIMNFDNGEETSIFFIPSYCKKKISVKDLSNFRVYISGKKIYKYFCYEEDTPYDVKIVKDNTDEIVFDRQVIFLKSENLYTMHLNLNGELKEIHNNKEVEMSGQIAYIDNNGVAKYSGEIDYIRGRGNSTWNYSDKKPYTLKLNKGVALCGQNKVKKYILLANAFDGTKMCNKIAFDLAKYTRLEYIPETRWIDLYINGEYQGNYLLCEQIDVNEKSIDINNLQKMNETIIKSEINHFETDSIKGFDYQAQNELFNITGGYLIEKDYSFNYQMEECGFTTNKGYTFSIKSPNNISFDEVNYIRDYVQIIENYMSIGDRTYFEYLDLDSLAKTFLINEIALNDDSSETSMFFYKDSNENKLYSGPLWDYDRAFGRDDVYHSYDDSILNMSAKGDKKEVLDWYCVAYEDEEYYAYLRGLYKDLVPYLNQMILINIDEYQNLIKKSVQMDLKRWGTNGDMGGIYYSFENNVRYLKWYLYNRTNYLIKRWGIEENQIELNCLNNDEKHTVLCIIDGKEYEYRVYDGECIDKSMLPYTDEKYTKWKYVKSRTEIVEWLPILEDIEIYSHKKED